MALRIAVPGVFLGQSAQRSCDGAFGTFDLKFAPSDEIYSSIGIFNSQRYCFVVNRLGRYDSILFRTTQ